ncbi:MULTISPECIES: hypothetical protein [Streptomyces]|uniref:Uncharacterized protein n=2 Tax=Streptomyces TaxID=1883 RepID=A0ABV9IXQ2_9ACTN
MSGRRRREQRLVRVVAFNGIPATAAVPTGAPHTDGDVTIALALIGTEQDSREEIDAFLARHRFSRSTEIARAKDSQARWTIERDGRITVTFLADDEVAQVVLPSDEGFHRWAGLAIAGGGTLAVWFFPEMTSFGPEDISRRIAPTGGEWWRLSVGYVAA